MRFAFRPAALKDLHGAVNLLFAGVTGVQKFEPRDAATATVLDRDICLVVDRSGSMMWTMNNSQYPSGTSARDKPDPTRSRWAC